MLALGCTKPSSQDGRPNILVVITDDQRAQGTLAVMPEVRRLFRVGGTEYVNAFTTTPLCCPARASIFSGRYAHNHGVKHNYQSARLDQDATVQWHLRDAGYRTAIAGKFLNHWDSRTDPPHFDRWAIFLQGEYYNRRFNIDGEVSRLPGYTTNIVRENALEFVADFEEEDDRPWFLYVATGAAHAPFLPEPRYEDAPVPTRIPDPALEEKDVTDKPRFATVPDPRSGVRRRQLRTLMSADDLVGALFDELEATGELDNTLAVFSSDNGMQWGEHGFTGKRQAYSESVRVPMFLRWPGEIQAGGRDDRLAANIDLAPTFLEAAGIETPTTFDGHSLLGGTRRSRLLIEHWGDPDSPVPDWASLRTNDYQYVEYYTRDSVSFTEYYDLRRDPFQLTNLLGDDSRGNDPDLARLRRRLARDVSCTGADCP